VKELFGGILMAIGILIAGASGICSLMMLVDSGQWGGALSMLPMVLIFGGVPLAGGVGIAFLGRSLIRGGRAERDSEDE
jgi:hypothetical protein